MNHDYLGLIKVEFYKHLNLHNDGMSHMSKVFIGSSSIILRGLNLKIHN